MVFLAFFPSVRRCDREPGAVGAERHRGDGGGVLPRQLQALLVLSIPHDHSAVTATRSKGAVGGVERQRVHREYSVNSPSRVHLTMALKRVFPALCLLRLIKVLHRNASLNGTQCIAGPIGIATNTASLEFERRLSLLGWFCHVSRVKNPHVTIVRSHNQFVTGEGHCEDLVWKVECRRANARARIPNLYGLVPTSGENRTYRRAVLHTPNRRVVCPQRRLSTSIKVERFHRTVNATTVASLRTLAKATIQHRSGVVIFCAQCVHLHVVEAHNCIPRRCEE
mmetsp:Transcript_40740/g.95177  ORF Transcript_40740/g.95177 Transcript_40740/m.95177 type:complete len:281 (+) Transcript_40740:247-1089(+)